NGPENVVISGDAGEVDAIVSSAAAAGIRGRRLTVSHAFHSPLVDPALPDIEAAAAAVGAKPLTIPLASNLSGELLMPGTVIPASYGRLPARNAVLFREGLRRRGENRSRERAPDGPWARRGEAALGAPARSGAGSLRRGRPAAGPLPAAGAALFTAG